MKTRFSPARRGILLLVILGLLAMFAMVALAYVVLTAHERRSAEVVSHFDRAYDPPEQLLNQAASIVVRGSNDPASAIHAQSLLEKIYGNLQVKANGHYIPLKGRIVKPAPQRVCGGQLIQFNYNLIDSTGKSEVLVADPEVFRRVGCVLTFTKSPNGSLIIGESTRIVGFSTGTTQYPQMLAPEAGTPGLGDEFVINGPPYCGMGNGYNTSTGRLDVKSGGIELALLPNHPTNWSPPGLSNCDYTAPDHQDTLLALQVPINTTNDATKTQIVTIPSLHRSDLVAYVAKKSNWKTGNKYDVTTWGANKDLLRAVMFRPNRLDHPNFTGSNPNFNPLWDGIPDGKSQWDVDNDGDGVPDSVWVDLGIPVRWTADGRAYKPLFAILCVDMDGKLNLNAHGMLAQTNLSTQQQKAFPVASPSQYYKGNGNNITTWVFPQKELFGVFQNSAFAGVGLGAQVMLPRGLGSGTAEVSLLPIFRDPKNLNNTPLINSYLALLTGITDPVTRALVPGRYGNDLGVTSLPNKPALPGIPNNYTRLNYNDWFLYNETSGVATPYWQFLTTTPKVAAMQADAYGSPPDTQGYGAIGVDSAGRPLYALMGLATMSNPYCIDLSRNAPHGETDTQTIDNPFSPAELERILRGYDRDSTMLPTRLLTLATDAKNTPILPYRRTEITTESWDPPIPSYCVPLDTRNKITEKHPLGMIDLLATKMGKTPAEAMQLALKTQMLPYEVLEGRKMDLNRPYGNGRVPADANLSSSPLPIPDQPPNVAKNIKEYFQQCVTANGKPGPVEYFQSPDGSDTVWMSGSAKVWQQIPMDALRARQLYARHLFTLLLLLTDPKGVRDSANVYVPSIDRTIDGTTLQENGGDAQVQSLAQWAINAACYRDSSSIMVPFRYDRNPFDGWDPDKDTNDDPEFTVWGVKRPELLITETVAFHDRRTEDRSDEVYDKNKPLGTVIKTRTAAGLTTGDPKKGKQDPSFNQHYRPQGSLFVELYNPSPADEPQSLDLASGRNGSDPNSANGGGGVELTRVNDAGSPVWRMIIVDQRVNPWNAPGKVPLPNRLADIPDPDEPEPFGRTNKTERIVYFAPRAAIKRLDTDYPAHYVKVGTPPQSKLDYRAAERYFPSAYPKDPTTNKPGPLVIPPGHYAVIGPGETAGTSHLRTFIGITSKVGDTTGQYISMSDNAADPDCAYSHPDIVHNDGSTALGSGKIQVPRVLRIDDPFRLSVSEPPLGYPYYEKSAAGQPFVYDSTKESYTKSGKDVSIDIPLDQQRDLIDDKAVYNNVSVWPMLNTDQTIPHYRIVYLQRLANPYKAWAKDPVDIPNPPIPDAIEAANPYRTIDAMAVDLTVFNGVTTAKDPTSGSPDGKFGVAIHFEARQRGEQNAPLGEMDLWKQEPQDKPMPGSGYKWQAAKTAANTSSIFKKGLIHSLGHLNTYAFGLPITPKGTNDPRKGDPQKPFPWFPWAGRPFINAYELLQVPAVSSSRLLGYNNGAPGDSTAKPPIPATAPGRMYYGYLNDALRSGLAGKPQSVYDPPSLSSLVHVPFPHLLNFFQTSPPSPNGSAVGIAPQFYRLLDFVTVPSRFVGTEIQIPPKNASTGSHLHHPPFNRISTYREPGRVNLNTVPSQDVFLGMMNYFPGMTGLDFYDKFVRSRRGDMPNPPTIPNPPTPNAVANVQQEMLKIDANVPSRWARPFRTAGGASLFPPSITPTRETDVTLLRGDPDYVGNSTKSLEERPLFEVDDTLMKTKPGGTMNFDGSLPPRQGSDAPPWFDYNRTPYFRYQAIQHLGGVATTRSNVFAVWITVGYFEVTKTAVTTANPDGYLLGPELNMDTGDVVRHRAFYLFDRSIPVGFQRAVDLNQDKAMLIRRFIE